MERKDTFEVENLKDIFDNEDFLFAGIEDEGEEEKKA